MSEHVEMVKTKINNFLASNPKIDEPVGMIAGKLNCDKPTVVVAAVAMPWFLLLLWGNGNFAVDMVGFLYPAWASIKAIESVDKEDDTMLLTYWFIFTLFKVLEGFIGWLFASIPFFFLMKALLLVYLYHPKTKGADQIYKHVIKPFVVPHLGITEQEVKKKE